MKAVNKADANFNNRIILDFHKNIKLLIVVNFLCVISILFFYTLFYYLLKLLGLNSSTDILFYIQAFDNLPSLNKYIFCVLILITAIIHELIHGLFFYIFTGDRPKIGFKSIYAYAGAPDWYIHKNKFFIISLSPLVIITILAIIILSVIPDSCFPNCVFIVYFECRWEPWGYLGLHKIIKQTERYIYQ
jgi:hypothetical protein